MNPSLQHLVETLFWSETNEMVSQPFSETHSISGIEEKSLSELNRRFQEFVEEAEKKLTEKFGDSWSSIDDFYTGSATGGFYTEHDFILTVNGHGCGFWERGDWQDGVGELLRELADKYREIHPYVGDDGKVHIYFG